MENKIKKLKELIVDIAIKYGKYNRKNDYIFLCQLIEEFNKINNKKFPLE